MMINKALKSVSNLAGRFPLPLITGKVLRIVPSILFFTFICWLISMADLNKENLIMTIGHKVPSGDKIGHFLLFGMLAYFLNCALKFKQFNYKNRRLYLGSVIVLLFAVCEEFSQLAFENRTFDWVDMVFDFWGVITLSSEKVRSKAKFYLDGVIAKQREVFSFSILKRK